MSVGVSALSDPGPAHLGDASDVEDVLTRLDTLAWRLDRGECPPVDEMDALAEAARGLGPTLDREGRARLAEAVAGATCALDRACTRLRERIVLAGTGRRATRAYAAQVTGGAR